MALEVFTANDIDHTVSPEPAVPDGMKNWAVVQVLLVDEITGQSPAGSVTLQTTFSGLSPRVAPGGKIGLAAIPLRAFPLLRLKSYPIQFSINADGYVPLLRNETMASNLAFPGSFTPLDLGAINLHRLPTMIAGRVAVNTGIAQQAIPGTTVTLTRVWRTPPPATLVVPPSPPDLVSLKPELYFDRAQVGTQIQGLDFLGVPGPDKQLLQDAAASQSLLKLSDRALIGVGDILAIDIEDAERTEYVTIKNVIGSSTDDLPALITLDSPLRSIHRQGATAHKVQFQNVGAVTQLTSDAIAGDACVFVNGVGSLAGALFLSVQTGGMPVEYHAVRYFSSVSDAQGFFRWPPISRVAQCGIHIHDGVHTDLDVNYSPDYSQEVSRIDFVYR